MGGMWCVRLLSVVGCRCGFALSRVGTDGIEETQDFIGQQVRRLLSAAELAGWWLAVAGPQMARFGGDGDKDMVIWNGAKVVAQL